MSQLSLVFALLLAALVQAMIPTTAWTGWAPAPILGALVTYFALVRPRGLVLEAAVLAGLIEDALGQMPLGTSSFAYAVAGLVMERYREDVVVRQWTTHVVFGAIVNLFVTLFALLILIKDGLIHPAGSYLALRLLGALGLGGIVTPVVFAVLEQMDRMLGFVEEGTG